MSWKDRAEPVTTDAAPSDWKSRATPDTTPESESFVQGFFKTYKGEPKTTLQKADVLAGKASNAVLKVANAPFEAATAPLETATAAMEGRPAEPLSVFGGQPSNPLSTVNKLLRAGAAALAGIPGGTALNSARTAYNAPRGGLGVAEDTAMGALLGAVAPEAMAAPVDTAIAGAAKTGKVVKDVASSLGKKAISTAFDVPEAAVAARFANPEAIKSAGTAENLALNDVPAVGDKFKQVISGLQDEAKKTLSTSKFLEPQVPTQDIVVAMKKGKEIIKGTPGETHAHVWARMEDSGTDPGKFEDGFFDTRTNKYLTREQAAKAIGSSSNEIDSGDLAGKFNDPTSADKGGAFTKDEVIGAIASAKRKLGGTWTAAGKTASKTLANLADSLKKATNTISQNQVHDYIMKLDEEIPWTKVWKAPESLTLEDNAMIDVRTKLDGILKDRNQDYAKVMEPLSDAINTRNEFLKKFALEKQKDGGYQPSDTTTSRIQNATKENKLGTQRTLAKVKATTGEDLLPKIENAQTLAAFQPSSGLRGDTLFSSVRNTLSSPPMAARIIDMLSRGKTGVGNVLAAVNSQTEGTPLQDIIKRILQGQPALAPFIKGQQ